MDEENKRKEENAYKNLILKERYLSRRDQYSSHTKDSIFTKGFSAEK